ncbi:MAG: hypothetical protein KDK36_19095, partial [Leptospiraceae bacterium]|nr:hypothetical protein [Leptospiraceae bacterium]
MVIKIQLMEKTQMENTVKEIVNLGIGIYRSGEETLKSSLVSAENFFNEVKTKGESNTSEQANQLRDLLNKALTDLSELETNAKNSYEEFANNLETKYNELASKIDENIPESLKENIQSSIDQIKSLIENAKEEQAINASEATAEADTPAPKKGKS